MKKNKYSTTITITINSKSKKDLDKTIKNFKLLESGRAVILPFCK